MPDEKEALKDLMKIPGVGKSIARDLMDIGYFSIADLAGADPGDMYAKLCILQGTPVDRCVLYVFRCAVYFAENETPDPELLKWWNWKDRTG
jgi:hypothetical protein